MGKDKKSGQAGVTAKEKHRRAGREAAKIDRSLPLPAGLIAKRAIPKSKHQSYFEFVENKDKKKKLEFEITTDRNPPPGFEFIPVGYPALTAKCKDISREQDAMVFIVTMVRDKNEIGLHQQVNRIGHHVRETIVDQARAELGVSGQYVSQAFTKHGVEAIPEHQDDINAQADAAILDLFPKIPNTDRQVIIQHAFKKGQVFGVRGEPVVGLQQQLPLSRRVQLAVLAHIRHNHTRYDELLKETSWSNARRAVEALCLDILVKWRGDDETGRDQLDEILREVVFISDTEDSESDGESSQDSSEEQATDPGEVNPVPVVATLAHRYQEEDQVQLVASANGPSQEPKQDKPGRGRPKKISKKAKKHRPTAKNAQRNFIRYQAAWDEAKGRQQASGQDHKSLLPDGAWYASYDSRLQVAPGQPVAHAALPGGAPRAASPPNHRRALSARQEVLPRRSYDAWNPTAGTVSSTHPPPSTYPSPHIITHSKLNEAVYMTPPGFIPRQQMVRSSEGDHLQDLLHPSIEPQSPRNHQSTYRPSAYAFDQPDRPGAWPVVPHRRPLSPAQVGHAQEPGSFSLRTVAPGPGHTLRHVRTVSDDYDLRREVQRSDIYYHSAPDPSHGQHQFRAGPGVTYSLREPRLSMPQHGRATGWTDEQSMFRDVVQPRIASGPILVQDHRVDPSTWTLGPGRNTGEIFSRDREVIALRRPDQDISRRTELQRDKPMEEGFVKLSVRNEYAPREIPAIPAARWPPIDRSEVSSRAELRAGPEDTMSQPIYVRRVERVALPRASYECAPNERPATGRPLLGSSEEQLWSSHPPPPPFHHEGRPPDRPDYQRARELPSSSSSFLRPPPEQFLVDGAAPGGKTTHSRMPHQVSRGDNIIVFE